MRALLQILFVDVHRHLSLEGLRIGQERSLLLLKQDILDQPLLGRLVDRLGLGLSGAETLGLRDL